MYITYAHRTPIGKIKGQLAPLRPDDMLAQLLTHFKNQLTFEANLIDDVIVGCANQAGEDNRNIARMSLVLAGFPFEVPGTTINRLCASSLDALIDAWCRIQSGLADCIVVGGVESMSRAPFVLSKASHGYDNKQTLYDTSLGWRFPNPKMAELFPLYAMGETAEEVASLHKISREDQDQFAFSSHQKAVAAQDQNLFEDEIVPMTVPGPHKKSPPQTITTDESPRKDTSLEKLAKLTPAFRQGGSVTAGNSSSLNDGASLVCLVSESFLKTHQLQPPLQITGAGIRGCHPNTMGLGPIEATRQLSRRYKIPIESFDVVEVNEAFAAQSLACLRELQIAEDRVNRRGGAIALGHPLGCSGLRLVTTLTHQMKRDPQLKRGLATLCVGVGQGVAASFENMNS